MFEASTAEHDVEDDVDDDVGSSSSRASSASSTWRPSRRAALLLPAALAIGADASSFATTEETDLLDDGTRGGGTPRDGDGDGSVASDGGEAVSDAEMDAGRLTTEPEEMMVGDVKLVPYRDLESGYSLMIPAGWQKDVPKANTPEFHPVSEYGGRRFRVEVTPAGRVSGGRNTMAALADTDDEEMLSRGYDSPASYANVEATKFAPVEGAPGAPKPGKGSAVSQIVQARASPDGRYYYYEYRVESIYPLRFWGASAVGPGQIGGARKLGRRDVVSVVCQMPEDKATPEDFALLQAIVDSFRVDDF